MIAKTKQVAPYIAVELLQHEDNTWSVRVRDELDGKVYSKTFYGFDYQEAHANYETALGWT